MVKIGFTGDFCPQERIEKAYHQGEWQLYFEEIRVELSKNDLTIADLECPLTTSSQGIVKTGPHLKCHPDTADILTFLGIRLVVTANNHFLDYGEEGMTNTFSALKARNIQWLGAGCNLKEASTPHFVEIKGLTFGIINFAENEWSTTHGAGAGVNPLDEIAIYNQIRYAKEKSDFVIVISHGGHEHYPLPSPRMKKLFRFLVDAGASAVINHHTHIISGFEVYNEAPIFYSLGNFCFDWPGKADSPWNLGMVPQLLFEKGKPVGYETAYVEQNSTKPGVYPLAGDRLSELMDSVEKLNTFIQDDEYLEKAFVQHADTLANLMLTWLEPYAGRILPGLRFKGWIPSLNSSRKKRLMTNLIRCESHREVLLNALNNK
ncbi:MULTISPECIES: CapA family protein [unclassified Imperialibacter]|uniref:CapA family protein n=1 Tax=unclassified Imperialibacter TaxID=2629706 RepID=UPI001258758B|nr:MULTISPECIES: CapA family protein [unclassified Imperialibacter]CAD5253026.1 conserved hypothetical protein [Imperialibacter sp. 89]CAD5261202.1 conserved hypothetical protein [Imperialibacter sp. 75]VVT03568.1 conserved hypothetical protein [Imperialibacter sp. EC-SDR9]